MRIIGMDIHCVAAEVVALCEGEVMKLGRVPMLRDQLESFARKELTHDDHVVIEATGNAAAVAGLLGPFVDRVVIANPKQVRMIAHAKIKTDAIDAAVLAKLYATGFLPEVWIPDAGTLAMRWQVARRTQLVRQRVRLKNMIQSILHAHLVPPCPHGNLVGVSGRNRRCPTLSRPPKACRLSRLEPKCPAVGRRTRLPWSDHQAGPRPGARHAGRSGLGSSAIAWTA